MPDIIHLLPDSVANQIAAGEVVQRPSSVVKELVENAIDAGATLVQVYVTDAGKTNIQVVDNGKGMSATDARLAFERHATSKIARAEDLFTLTTMGFRGEALPSIAAVSQVELRTRTQENELGTLLRIEGSQVKEDSYTACPAGTNISVRNLFYNIPARRKFLKSNVTEMANVLSEFERVALANPAIAFKLFKDDTLILDLPGCNFRQRIVGLFGKRLSQQLLPVKVETTLADISGFITAPETARKKGARQFFFVNGRFMRHPYFARAVQAAYERLMPEGMQASFFLTFEVEPARIDVNIHPTKTEIKFQDEPALWQIVLAACREALGRFHAAPSIDFESGAAPEMPVFSAERGIAEAPQISIDTNYNPFTADTASGGAGCHGSMPHPKSIKGWESLYEGLQTRAVGTPTFSASALDARETDSPTSFSDELGGEDRQSWSAAPTDCFQYAGRFIVLTVHSGLLLVDQHRAHMRVLYDDYFSRISERRGATQGLLFPREVQLTPVARGIYETLHDTLCSVGFDVERVEDDVLLLKGVPAGTEGLDPEQLLLSIIDEATEGNAEAADAVAAHICLSLARRAALPVGQVLSQEEMQTLLKDLFARSSPRYAPDGSLVLSVIPAEHIEKLFT